MAAMALRGDFSHSVRRTVTCLTIGRRGLGEEALHHVLVHAGGGAEDTGADVGDVGELEEALDGAVFAEGAVEDGEDDVELAAAEALRVGNEGGDCVGWRLLAGRSRPRW